MMIIEVATGVAFLMSSLYGAGHTNATSKAVTVTTVVPTTEQVTEIETSSLTDPKTIEMLVRKEFADEPIMIEIARCESTFRHYDSEGNLLRGRVDSRDIGVMQINTYYHGPTAERMGIDLETLEGNFEYARYLYDKNGVRDWMASAPCWSGDLARK